MASARFEQLLAGTAVALALALTPYAGSAFAASEAEIAAAVPVPESADLPPPSIKDVIAPADAAMQPETPAAAAPKPEAPVDAAAATPAAAEPTNSTLAASTDDVKFNTASVSADTALVDKLRDQLASGKFDRILGGKKERLTIEA